MTIIKHPLLITFVLIQVALLDASREAQAAVDVPTGLPSSPLFGAKPFTQQMLRFEEFGLQDMPTAEECTNGECEPFPTVSGCSGLPNGNDLDAFINGPLHPLPTRQANTSSPNLWHAKIDQCIGGLETSSLEGRPPGEHFAHQRWGDFTPEVYFQTAQTGARRNRGMRDTQQLHQYSQGEFAPGGLYHNTTGRGGGFDGSTDGIKVQLHRRFPVQKRKSLWTFDGTFPPKLLMARYGSPILFRHYNALPINPGANGGFGLHTLSTHEHNGHNPAESDGYTQSFFYPGQFYDYRWPMILAGHDEYPLQNGSRAGAPDGNGGIKNIPGDWRETMSTHWFHDHMIDFTAQNVYKGNAAAMNYYSAVDRGNEGLNCHYDNSDNANLCLPSGTALDWGNRDYDVNLMVADKAWDSEGQLDFNIFNTDGFLGDQMTVNWLYKPNFEVRARRYRFRILNGSVSRYFKIAVMDQKNKRVPFHMVANDGNIMEHAIPFPGSGSADLPTLGVAERYDIVIDFSGYKEGDKIYLVNLLQHDNGRGPKDIIPKNEAASGRYVAGGGDPAVGRFLQFRVKDYDGTDLSMDPANYEPGKKKMIPLPGFTKAELANAKHRTFEFGRSDGTDDAPWTIKTDGGMGFSMDPRRLSAAPDKGSVEIWHLKTGGGWSHPVHVHFEEGQILKRGGERPPKWERWARKDVYRIGTMDDSTHSVDLAIRFRDFMGTYMEHCHNTQHEDTAMLLRWDVQNPGSVVTIPTPIPRWSGHSYVDTDLESVPTYKTGDVTKGANF